VARRLIPGLRATYRGACVGQLFKNSFAYDRCATALREKLMERAPMQAVLHHLTGESMTSLCNTTEITRDCILNTPGNFGAHKPNWHGDWPDPAKMPPGFIALQGIYLLSDLDPDQVPYTAVMEGSAKYAAWFRSQDPGRTDSHYFAVGGADVMVPVDPEGDPTGPQAPLSTLCPIAHMPRAPAGSLLLWRGVVHARFPVKGDARAQRNAAAFTLFRCGARGTPERTRWMETLRALEIAGGTTSHSPTTMDLWHEFKRTRELEPTIGGASIRLFSSLGAMRELGLPEGGAAELAYQLLTRNLVTEVSRGVYEVSFLPKGRRLLKRAADGGYEHMPLEREHVEVVPEVEFDALLDGMPVSTDALTEAQLAANAAAEKVVRRERAKRGSPVGATAGEEEEEEVEEVVASGGSAAAGAASGAKRGRGP